MVFIILYSMNLERMQVIHKTISQKEKREKKETFKLARLFQERK